VLAVANGWYRTAHPRWQETILKDIAEASRLYQLEFGIALKLVDTRAWDKPTTLTMPGELAALKRAYPVTHDYDVVIGFTARSGLVVAGISEILGSHLLVAATPFHNTAELLAHELGRIFGARDTFTASATQLFLGPCSPSLLPEGFRVAIREHKWRLFRLPAALSSYNGSRSFQTLKP